MIFSATQKYEELKLSPNALLKEDCSVTFQNITKL